MSGTMDEETLFRNRLAIDERAVKRCLKRFQAYVKSTKTHVPQADRDTLFDLFKLDLAQTELSFSCQEMVSIALEQEEQACDDDLKKIESQLKETEAAIAQCKLTLARERKANSQKLEYNSIIKKIQEYNSRAALKASIIEAKASILSLEKERETQHKCALVTKASLQEILDQVQKFQTLVSAIESSPSTAIENLSKTLPATIVLPEEIPDSSHHEDSDCELLREIPRKSSVASIVCSSPGLQDEPSSRKRTPVPDSPSAQKRRLESPSIEEGEWAPRSPKKSHLSE